jgi:hypothetical protein
MQAPDDGRTRGDESAIFTVPRDRVRELEILAPPDSRPPNPSVGGRLSRALGGPQISATPLGAWIGDTYHGVRVLE